MQFVTFQDTERPYPITVGIPEPHEVARRRDWQESDWDKRFRPLTSEQERRFEVRLRAMRKAHENERKSRSEPRTPHTYLVGAEGSPLVKIGYTSGTPLKRLASLQTGQPMTLSLLWSVPVDIEDDLHERFASYRVRGEWFDLTPLGDAVEVVQSAAQQMQLSETP
ncbi:GIY-YIG nuclease family protein [Streptomyces sp. NPDC046862]|uniref:GIY-YIG nuclease family protein n=1 Tax=Streptomyces sp. NPDC046862 TaxID=3154603 RepID=UPI003451B2CC